MSNYYFYPDNLYPAPNNAMQNADILLQNIKNEEAAPLSILPFNNYNTFNNFGYYNNSTPPIGIGFGGYSTNPFMKTNYNYTRDALGNVNSSYSQHPDYLGIGLSSIGLMANSAATVAMAGMHSKTMRQQQEFENMAYQQSSANMAYLQQQQNRYQQTQDSLNMMINMQMMQKMMNSLG